MNCPKCGYKFDDHTSPFDEKLRPKKGDISICLNCGAVHQFNGTVVVDVDINKLPLDTQKEILMIQNARKKVLGT